MRRSRRVGNKNGREHGMQTIYFETDRFIRHEGTVVDLAAYRQKLSAVSGGNWSPQFDEELTPERVGEEPPRLTILPAQAERTQPLRPRRKRRTDRLALVLDLCASLAIIALTACAVLSFLRF